MYFSSMYRAHMNVAKRNSEYCWQCHGFGCDACDNHITWRHRIDDGKIIYQLSKLGFAVALLLQYPDGRYILDIQIAWGVANITLHGSKYEFDGECH